MKLIYVTRFFAKEPFGVQKKILSQVKSLNNLGLPAIIYSLTEKNDDSPLSPLIQKIIIPNLEYQSPKNFFAKKRRTEIRDYAYHGIIETLGADEILYTRIPYPSKITSRLLKNPRKCKIVIEYQTIGPHELRSLGAYSSLLYDFFYGDDIRMYTDAIVGITDEITHYELTRCGDPDKPCITIGNGINIDSVSIREPVPYSGGELHILCVANVRPWHGLDRLIRGLGTYHGQTRVTLHIAGEGSELPRLNKLINDLDISGRVIFYGFTRGKDLDDLFDNCHIAVGTLGMHRKGLAQTSELKAREYCARGIPYIISCTDPDFPEDFPYIHRVPSDESPICIEKIIEFARRVLHDPEHPKKMRAYAAGHLDWSIKMKILKAFLENLVDESR